MGLIIKRAATQNNNICLGFCYNGYKIRRGYIDKGKISLLIWTSFIRQFIHPVEGGRWVKVDGIVILASCEHHFIRVLENLVKHLS